MGMRIIKSSVFETRPLIHTMLPVVRIAIFVAIAFFWLDDVEGKKNRTHLRSHGHNVTLGRMRWPPDSKTVHFYLFTRKRPNKGVKILPNPKSLKKAGYNKHKRTILLIHGIGSSANEFEGFEHTVKHALFKNRKDVNAILVDWKYYSEVVDHHPKKYYSFVVPEAVPGVGKYVGKFVKLLIRQGAHCKKIRIVGHGVGAHVAGFAGKHINKHYNIREITGLDPAGPGFRNKGPAHRLAKGDAAFVQVIHTNGQCLGLDKKIGDADFYPNAGVCQPGCKPDENALETIGSWPLPCKCLKSGSCHMGNVCSHRRSWQYFAESINRKHDFKAKKCRRIAGGKKHGCHGKFKHRMGYYANCKESGQFWLKTNRSYPFSRNCTPSRGSPYLHPSAAPRHH